MDYYFVAKTKEAGFISQLPLEEIVRRFHAGELLGDYVATKSVGPSYRQLMKSGTAAWITVADLVAHLPAQNAETVSDVSGNPWRGFAPSPAPPLFTQPRVLSTLLILLGALLVLAPLAFIDNPQLIHAQGFLASLPRLRVWYGTEYYSQAHYTLPYANLFVVGLLLMAAGIGVWVVAVAGARGARA